MEFARKKFENFSPKVDFSRFAGEKFYEFLNFFSEILSWDSEFRRYTRQKWRKNPKIRR